MAVNKVVFGNEVKMDLTNDTVSAENLLEGETAHNRSGNPVVGTAKQGHSILNKLGTLLTQRSKLKFGGMLKTTDDGTNDITVVSDEAEEIEWSVWDAMTEVEQNAYSAGKKLDILHAPLVQNNKVPKTDIATIEPSNTASRAYSVGELVYVNGNLYKVITAISIGATFTVGTNIQSTNVSQETNKVTTGTLTLSVTTTATGNIYADTRDRTGLTIPKPNPNSVLLGVVVNPETPYNQSFWVGRLVSTGNTIDRMFIFSPNAMSNVSCTFRYFAFWA